MVTQLELVESARRRVAKHAHAINWMWNQGNRPTREELVKLKQKNPRVWGAYPESFCK